MHEVILDSSAWVSRYAPLISDSGPVLDLACGSGRHSGLLASMGHSVLAVDQNIPTAEIFNSSFIEFLQMDLEGETWPLEGRTFSAIVVTNYLYRPYLDRLPQMLLDGGILIYETFAQGNAQFGKPSNPDFLLNPGELLVLAAQYDLRVLGYEDIRLEEPKPAMVQRICAVNGQLRGG